MGCATSTDTGLNVNTKADEAPVEIQDEAREEIKAGRKEIKDDGPQEVKQQPHRVVIVGASFGGNGCFHGLLDDAGVPPDDLQITILDRKEHISIGGAFQFVWSDRVPKENISWPMTQLKQHSLSGIDFRCGEEGIVHAVDMASKGLRVGKNNALLKYDSLVLAPGVVSDPSSIPGLSFDSAIDVCAFDQVDRMQSEMRSLMAGAIAKAGQKPQNGSTQQQQTAMMVVTHMPYKCPPLPFEVVSLIDDLLRAGGKKVRNSTRIILAIPVDFPFGGPPAKKMFCELLEEMEIEFWNFHTLTSVEKIVPETNNGLTSSCHVRFEVGQGDDKVEKELDVDALFCTFPQRAPDFMVDAGLTNANGFVPVHLQTNRIKDVEDMYVIGDACHVVFPKPKKPHPKAGEFAYKMGQSVAQCILSRARNQSDPTPPEREASCVAEVGKNGSGVNIRPNFSDILANPDEGMPKFLFPTVEGAAQVKSEWINGYLEKFFGKGNYTSFPSFQ
eukprot:scaffold31649_cov53-Attheya_sp.AAC.4